MTRRWRFTFLEALGAILLILVGTGLRPDLQAWWREVTRQGEYSDCLSNLNQLVKATLMYAEDYDGRGPQTWFDADGSGHYDPSPPAAWHTASMAPDGHSDYAWSYALFGYTKSFQIFTCQLIATDQNWDGSLSPATDSNGISYGYNSRLGALDWRLDCLAEPWCTVLVCDVTAGLREPWVSLPVAWDDRGTQYQVDDRHIPRANLWQRLRDEQRRLVVTGFADGHAKALPKARVLASGRGLDPGTRPAVRRP